MKELLTPTAVQIRSDSHNNSSTFESHKARRQKIGLIWPTMPPEMCLYHLCSHTSLTPASESNWQTLQISWLKAGVILHLYWSYQYWVFTDKSSFLPVDKADIYTYICIQQAGRKWNWTFLRSKPLLREAAVWVNDCTGGDALQMGQVSPMELCAILLMVHSKAWELSSEVITSRNLVIPPEWEKNQSWTTATALTRWGEPIQTLRLQLLKLSATTLKSV